MKLKIKYIYIK